MKKIILTLAVAMIALCAFVVTVGAQSAYTEEIPEILKTENDQAEYFVVFKGEEYYTGAASINGLNDSAIKAELDRLGISLGSKYLAKYIFPEKMGDATVTKIDFNGGIKRNGYFSNACGAVVLPSTTNTVTDLNDCAGQLRLFDFGENNSITIIPSYFLGSATRLARLENFPAKLKVIEGNAFLRCSAMKGELYINAETIKYKAFDNGIGLGVTGIVFGPDVKNIEGEAFSTREHSGSSNVKYIEFQCDITQLNITESGSNTGAFYFASGSQRNPYSGLVHIILSNPAQADCAGKTFQDYLPKVYFNANSASVGNPVAPTHNYGDAKIEYDSFFASGAMSKSCKDCEKSLTGASLDPIFNSLGYSCTKVGAPSLVFGIRINYQALEFYNSNVSNELKISEYGLLAANKELVGDCAFDGTVAKRGTINANLMAHTTKNTIADIKITGLQGENNGVPFNHTDKELYLTAYVIVNGQVLYLDGNAQSATLSNAVTFNGLLATLE